MRLKKKTTKLKLKDVLLKSYQSVFNVTLIVLFCIFEQISALVTMYTHEEDIDSAIDTFSQAIQYYQSEQVNASDGGSTSLHSLRTA